jgi:hypothetical protein
MNDQQLRQAYQQYLGERASAGRGRCPSPESLQDLVERRGDESDRLAILDHVMTCPACRRELEMLRSITGAASALEGETAPSARHWPRLPNIGFAAAAGLLIVLGAISTYMIRRGRTAEFRDGDAIVLLQPSGRITQSEALRFAWRRAPSATSYRFELIGPTGDSVFTATTSDTVVLLPSSVRVESGSEYVWSVRGFSADGSLAASASLRFRLAQP